MQPYEKMLEQRKNAGLKSGEIRKLKAIDKHNNTEKELKELESLS